MKKRRPPPRPIFTSVCQTVQTPYGTFAVHGVNHHGEPVPAQGRLIIQPPRET